MVGTDQEIELLPSIRKKQLLPSAMERTSEWVFSQEVPTPSDIAVQVGDATFSLHKFPLVSKCGLIRRLISEAHDPKPSVIHIPDLPGGVEAFELIARFCYGINFEINPENLAMLRCAAEHLGMTDDFSAGNLVGRTEAYLQEVVLMSLSGAVTVLCKSEGLLPMAEKVKLIKRCIDAIAYISCHDSQFSMSLQTENSQESLSFPLASQPKTIVDWWAEELTVLRIDIFERVLMAMKARGFKQYSLGPVIMLYAQKSLRCLEIFGNGRKNIEPKQEYEKTLVLETIVNLLPRERNTMSVSFLSMLLRAATYLETTVACRLDLEKRMGLQLDQAVLDDLLIPSFSSGEDTIFDVDAVQRILMNYLDIEVDENRFDDEYVSQPANDIEQVGRLMESYLAEIAPDPNLTVSRFISLAELIPEQAKVTEDSMYRGIDIYLKAHPSLTDTERKKVCSLMNFQKLSREACAHAAQNDRLPAQIVVQVLYYEQQRIQNSTSGNFKGGDSPALSHKMSSYGIGYHEPADELLQLRKENDDLKLELVRLRMQLKEMERSSENSTPSGKPPLLPKSSSENSTPSGKPPLLPESSSENSTPSGKPPLLPERSSESSTPSGKPPLSPERSSENSTPSGKPPLPKKSIINTMTKKLGRLYDIVQSDSVFSGKVRTKPPKNHRHSIS